MPVGVVLLVACACGWLVMELEVLGARILAPYFGSTVYVAMGSVVGVFLLSLSGGYMLGGWLSRGRSSELTLAVSLLAAGAWLCAVPFFMEPVCDGILEAGFDEKWGSLVAAFALFSVPTALLGTVSPTAVRWLTRQVGESGFRTGLVLSLSNVASFAGCVVTAFYLVLLSVRWTILISGGLLALWQERALEGMLTALEPREGARGPEQGPALCGRVKKMLEKKAAEREGLARMHGRLARLHNKLSPAASPPVTEG